MCIRDRGSSGKGVVVIKIPESFAKSRVVRSKPLSLRGEKARFARHWRAGLGAPAPPARAGVRVRAKLRWSSIRVASRLPQKNRCTWLRSHPHPPLRGTFSRREKGIKSCMLPAHALRSVFQHDAFVGQLLADGIGAGEILGFFRCAAFVDQGGDTRIIAGIGAGAGLVATR